MSRIGTGDTVIVKPASNVYTVLAAIAMVMVILGIVVVWQKGDELYGGLLKEAPSQTSAPAARR